MRFLAKLVFGISFMVLLSFLYWFAGWLLCRSGKPMLHKIGCRLWAMSGLFLKRLPKHCYLTCDGSCRNWTCSCFHTGRV